MLLTCILPKHIISGLTFWPNSLYKSIEIGGNVSPLTYMLFCDICTITMHTIFCTLVYYSWYIVLIMLAWISITYLHETFDTVSSGLLALVWRVGALVPMRNWKSNKASFSSGIDLNNKCWTYRKHFFMSKTKMKKKVLLKIF